MILSSFKDTNEIFHSAERMLPSVFKLENYVNGWRGFGGISFTTFFKNSMFISIAASIGAVFSSALVAFGFARCQFKLRGIWFSCMMITLMLPFQVVMVPQFIMFQKIGWVGSFLPLIAPFFFGQAFFIFMIIQFIHGIPKELDEASRIDGCSIYGIFVRIYLPLITPALITSAIFSFMWRWDDFLASLLYLNIPSMYSVSMALKMFSDPAAQSDYGAMFAMAALSLVPIFFIFLIFQKYLVEGIATTGLKS
jgi:multiple sugar transport system permease protein